MSATLQATAEYINAMTMPERIEYLRTIRQDQFGLRDKWRDLEGVMGFFHDHGWGDPDTWVSWVNAGVLHSIARGISAYSVGDTPHPGAAAWASYIERYTRGELATRNLHADAWSHATEVSTDWGLLLATEHDCEPTSTEQRFLTIAQTCNWLMRNRPLLDFAVNFAPHYDHRLSMVTPAVVDWVMNTGDPDAAKAGCEVALAAAELTDGSLLDAVFQVLPQLVACAARAETAVS